MKKQFLSLTLAICMALTLLPTTVLAVATYDIWVGSTQVTTVNEEDVLGDGTVSFDSITSTLTLNNAHITSSVGYHGVLHHYTLICFGQAATLNLIGDNTIDASGISGADRSCGIFNDEEMPLTISGSGTLSISGGTGSNMSMGISICAPLIIDGCEVTSYTEATTGSFICGIWNWLNYGITIKNGATLDMYAPASTGFGFRANTIGARITIDDTSTVISKGGSRSGLLTTLSTNQIMMGSVNYDGTGAAPIYGGYEIYKFIEVKPFIIPTAADFTFNPPSDLTYSGTAKAAAVTTDKAGMGTVTVKYFKDGELATPKDVGTYTAKIDLAMGTSYASATDITDSSWTFTISPLDISDAAVGTFGALTYNGTAQTPTATVTKGSNTVTGSWSNVTGVTDKTTFTANGNFTGSIADKTPGMSKANPSYTLPTGLTATYGQTLADVALEDGFAWTSPLSTSVGNVGTNSFEVNYTPDDTTNYNSMNNLFVNVVVSSKQITFAIDDIAAVTYNGSAQTPVIVVKDDTTTLTKDVDYSISYSDNTNAGTATATVTGKGNYAENTASITFTINRANVINSKTDNTITYAGQTYDISQLFTLDSNAGTPSYTIESGGTGEGMLIGNMLSITKAGTITIGAATMQTVNYNAGDMINATLTVNKGLQEAPAGIAKLNASVKDGNDGKIQNVSTAMEYKIDGGEYTEVTGDIISGLSKGVYCIRYKQTECYNAGVETIINIDEPAVIKADDTVPDGITLETPIQSGDTLEIKVANASVTAPEIQALSGRKAIAIVLDITAEVNNLPSATLPSLVKITLPIPETAKGRKIIVYRLHEGIAEAMPEGEANKNADGEYIVIGTDMIEVYAKNFSQYAITYTKPSNGGGGGETLSCKITVTQSEGGKISPDTVSVTKNSTKTFTITPSDGYEIEGVFVDGKSAGVVKEYTFDKITASAEITAKFKKIEENPAKPTEPTTPEKWENTFTDVGKKDWFYEAVKYVNENGLMNGTDKTTFSPNMSVTRAMFVTVLYRAEKQPIAGAAPFTDIESGSYYEKAVAWASANGIVEGVAKTQFAPNGTITREQMAAIIQRYAIFKGFDVAASENVSFSDSASISEYAKEAVAFCAEEGIMNGKDRGTFVPREYAARAEVAAVIERTLNLLQ